MKKKLESELISIAHRILKLKGKSDVLKMHAEVSILFEKLSVLKFAQENFEDDIPTIGSDSSFFEMLEGSFNNKISDSIEIEDRIYVNLDETDNEEIMEPGIETIKDMVAQMPQDMEEIDRVFEEAISKQPYHKGDLDDITAGFQETPIFEPVLKAQGETLEYKKSLNDKLKNGALNIGLNDKLAFIKHLFEGKIEDYERVMSQISTATSFTHAKQFIEDMVKPDYHDWEGKEDVEERFMQIIESKFI